MPNYRLPGGLAQITVNGRTYRADASGLVTATGADAAAIAGAGGLVDGGAGSAPEWSLDATGTADGLIGPDGTKATGNTAIAAAALAGGSNVNIDFRRFCSTTSGNGVDDDTAAFSACGTYLRALSRSALITVDFPQGKSYLITDGTVFSNINKLRLNFNGSTVKNTTGYVPGANTPALLLGRTNQWRTITDIETQRAESDGTADSGDLINNAAPGDFTVTLSPAGAGSGYVAGDKVFIFGRAGQTGGFPPNPIFFDYAIVSSVSGDTLTLDKALTGTYRTNDTEALFSPDGVSSATLYYGAGRIINLTTRYFSDFIEVNDLEVIGKNPASSYTDDKGPIAIAGWRVNLNRVKCYYISVSMTKTHVQSACQSDMVEPDKCVERVEYIAGCRVGAMDTATGVKQFVARDSFFGLVSAFRAHDQDWERCDLTMTTNPATAYLSSYKAQGRIRLKDNTIRMTSSAALLVGSGFGGLLTESNSKFFTNTFTVSGTPTAQVQFAYDASRELDIVPGVLFMADKSGGGYCYGRIVAARKNGANWNVDVACSGVMAANGSVFTDQLCDVEYLGNVIAGTQLNDQQGAKNVRSVVKTGDGWTIAGRIDLYRRIGIPQLYSLCHLDELLIHVRRPYAGGDASCKLQIAIGGAVLSTGAYGDTIAEVDLKTAGTRRYSPGYTAVALGADTATSTVFKPGQLCANIKATGVGAGANNITGDYDHTPNAANMPIVEFEMRIRKPARELFP